MLNILDKDVTNIDDPVSSPFVLDNIVIDNTQTTIVSPTHMHTEQPLPKLIMFL